MNKQTIKKTLTVILTKENNSWVAQGLEIDYVGYGESIETARNNFETGFMKTIELCHKMHGSISKLIKPAPNELWAYYFDAENEFITLPKNNNISLFEIVFITKKLD